MKSIMIFIFTLVSTFVFSQTVSTLRMGDIRLGMTPSEVSKIVNKPIKLSQDPNIYEKKITIMYQNVSYIITFIEMYDDQLEESVNKVSVISTYDSRIKTISNIGIGSSLDDLWSAYKNSTINIYGKWDEKTEKNSKEDRFFVLVDTDANTAIYFTLKNNIVMSISVSYYWEEGCC